MAHVHVTGRHFRQHLGLPDVVYDVLYCGERYQCDRQQLERLYDGEEPEALGLIPQDDDDD